MKPDFAVAYQHVMGHEIGPHAATRGYVNDPDDKGGETVAGVSRVFHPGWEGWPLVDQLKGQPNFPRNLSADLRLDGMISSFYRREFWDKLHCDDMPDHSVALELFDTGVNMSQARAGMYLQQALNLLNNNGKLFSDITEDGVIGPATLSALGFYLAQSRGNVPRLLTVMNVLQGAFYVERMRTEKSQEKHLGWFDRVNLTRN